MDAGLVGLVETSGDVIGGQGIDLAVDLYEKETLGLSNNGVRGMPRQKKHARTSH